MSQSAERLTRKLILPAIGSFQYLASVNPQLQDARGNVYLPKIESVDCDLCTMVKNDGTIDIYNISGKNLAEGKEVVVTAVQEQLLAVPPKTTELQVTTTPIFPPTTPIEELPEATVALQDSLVPVINNAPIVLPFSTSPVIPLITTGYIEPPSQNGGAFIVKKAGSYKLLFFVNVAATAGGAGLVQAQFYANDAPVSSRVFAKPINFGAGQTDALLACYYPTTITQQVLDNNGGTRKLDLRVSTVGAGVTARLGVTGLATTNQSTYGQFSYDNPDWFSAP